MTRKEMIAWVRRALEHANMSQTALAQALTTLLKRNIDKAAVNKMLISEPKSGQKIRNIKGDELLAIARITGYAYPGAAEDIRSEDVAASLDHPPSHTVKVRGYVGGADGSEAHFYALADEDFEAVEAPPGSTDQTVAVEIKGKSWGALMEGWLVFYDDIRSPVTDDLIGHPCVIGLSDDRIVLKKIVRNRRGGFDLVSNAPQSPLIENAEIEWAAKVKDMRPRR
jgi:hypothetical protein